MARLQAMILGYLPEDPCVSRLLSTGAETRVYCCIRNRTSSELTEDRALLAGALLAKGGAVKLTREPPRPRCKSSGLHSSQDASDIVADRDDVQRADLGADPDAAAVQADGRGAGGQHAARHHRPRRQPSAPGQSSDLLRGRLLGSACQLRFFLWSGRICRQTHRPTDF